MAKITLRAVIENDAEFVYSTLHDSDYSKYYLERLISKNIEETKKEIRHRNAQMKKKNSYYFIVMKGKEMVGILDIYKISWKDKKASIGYGIAREYWGKGIGTLACKEGLKYMKKLKLHTAEASADPKNKASEKVLLKNGFVKLGIAKDYYFDRGKFIDRALYWKVL